MIRLGAGIASPCARCRVLVPIGREHEYQPNDNVTLVFKLHPARASGRECRKYTTTAALRAISAVIRVVVCSCFCFASTLQVFIRAVTRVVALLFGFLF